MRPFVLETGNWKLETGNFATGGIGVLYTLLGV
jgi:hypothetical protein